MQFKCKKNKFVIGKFCWNYKTYHSYKILLSVLQFYDTIRLIIHKTLFSL